MWNRFIPCGIQGIHMESTWNMFHHINHVLTDVDSTWNPHGLISHGIHMESTWTYSMWNVPNIFNLFSSQIQNFNFIWSVNYFINTLQVTIYVEKKQITLSSNNTYNIIRNNNKRDNKGWQERKNGVACGMRAAPVYTVALRRGREDEREGPNPPSFSPCPSSSPSPRVPPLVIPGYLLLCLPTRFSPHLGVCWRCSHVNVAWALICRRCAVVSKVGGIGLVVIGFGVSTGFRMSKAGVLRFLGRQRWLGCGFRWVRGVKGGWCADSGVFRLFVIGSGVSTAFSG